MPLDLKSIQGLYDQDSVTKNTPLKFSWLGHAAVLITAPGLNILFDPCLSDRCSPVSFAGPKRLHPIPCSIDEFPKTDAIILSHSHYDHTDLPMLKRIAAPHTQFFVPLGMGPILQSVGFFNVAEGDWWDSFEFEKREANGRVRKATIGMFLCRVMLLTGYVCLSMNYGYRLHASSAFLKPRAPRL